jgi:hypothetical protein
MPTSDTGLIGRENPEPQGEKILSLFTETYERLAKETDSWNAKRPISQAVYSLTQDAPIPKIKKLAEETRTKLDEALKANGK